MCGSVSSHSSSGAAPPPQSHLSPGLAPAPSPVPFLGGNDLDVPGCGLCLMKLGKRLTCASMVGWKEQRPALPTSMTGGWVSLPPPGRPGSWAQARVMAAAGREGLKVLSQTGLAHREGDILGTKGAAEISSDGLGTGDFA